jgi:hypothetical protein
MPTWEREAAERDPEFAKARVAFDEAADAFLVAVSHCKRREHDANKAAKPTVA